METNVIINDQDKLWTLITWITPVVLFFLAYIINEVIRNSLQKNELQILKVLLITQLQQLYQQIQDQIEQNNDCMRRASLFDEMDLRLRRHYGTNIERIRKIPFKDIFQILVKNPSRRYKKRDYYVNRFNKLFRIIDYYYIAVSTSYTNNDMIIRNINEFLEKWNSSQKQTANFRNFLISTLNSQQVPVSDDLFVSGFVQINKAFETKYGKNIRNLEIAFNELILPQIEHSKKNSNDPRSAYLMSILQESKQVYLETKAQRETCIAELQELNESLSKFNPELGILIEELKNKA